MSNPTADEQVMEWLLKVASKLDEEDASKVMLAGHTIKRLARERDEARASAARFERAYVELEARVIPTVNS